MSSLRRGGRGVGVGASWEKTGKLSEKNKVRNRRRITGLV